jgi:ribosomal RNA-processing protein 12
MNFFVAALAGTAHSQSGALICLRSVVRKYKRDISEQHISQLLQMALLLSKSEFREVIQSALSFIQTCASSLQFDFISSKLPEIIDAAMFWGKDSRNKYKQTVRVIFERLVKRFGADLIRSHLSNSTVCSNTAVVDAIAKEIRKKAREDEISEKNAAAQDHESVVSRKISGLKIRESEDRPLDLLDSVNNWDQLDDVSGEDELSDSDVEFETSKDGRMILNGLEEESENDAIESDSDEDSVTDRAESKSIAARTNITRKSVHSTATSRNNNNNNNKRKSKSRGEEENLITGSEYKATRAGGDVRLPGKPAPFAFLGFHKKLLNKRSKHQALRQYSTIHHKHQQQSSSTKKRKLK